MDEQIMGKTAFWRTHKKLKKVRPLRKTKSAKNAPKMQFFGLVSAFIGFLMLSSSFWPDSCPISPNLGRFRAIFPCWGVHVQRFMLQKFHFVVHLRYDGTQQQGPPSKRQSQYSPIMRAKRIRCALSFFSSLPLLLLIDPGKVG